MAKRTTKYSRQAILNLVAKDTTGDGVPDSLAICNVTGGNIFANGIHLPDDVKLYLGSSDDAEIFYNSSYNELSLYGGTNIWIVDSDSYDAGFGIDTNSFNNLLLFWGNTQIQLNNTSINMNDKSNDVDTIIQSDDDAVCFTVDGALNRVGVGVALAGHLAKMHIEQGGVSAAIPVLHLAQNDESEPFTRYVGGIEASAAKSISSWTNAAVNGFIQIKIGGNKKWIAYYNDPTS